MIEQVETKPNCYDCAHRRDVAGDAHSRCNAIRAKVVGDPHGIKSGWFLWPLTFDPMWLVSCNSFSTSEEDRRAPLQKLGGLLEIFGMLGGKRMSR